MLKQSVWIILSFYCSILAFSQGQVTILLDKNLDPGSIVEISGYHSGKINFLTSFKTNGKDSVVLNDFKSSGLYMISLKGFKNSAEFIYNSNENMAIDIDQNLMNGEIAITRSKENICYADLLKINTAYDRFLDSIQNVRRDLHITTSDFYGRCFYLDSLYETVALEKNGRLTYLQFSYPSTYTSDILAPLNLIPVASLAEKGKFQTPDAFRSYHYFKYAIKDSRILNHYAIDNYIIDFLSKYSQPYEEGIKKSIDYISETFKTDTATYSYISNLLIKSFLDAKTPELALYVMGQSVEGCAFDLGEKQAEYLSNYSHVQIGKQVDDIILNDINGQPNSLSNACKKGEFTILLFWISWCKHCGTFLPELKKIASSYKTKLNIFAVSLDESETEWKAFVNNNKLESWIHVSELKKIEKSTLAPRFMVTQTPTMFLLDKDRNILAKNLTKDQLIVELQNRLK